MLLHNSNALKALRLLRLPGGCLEALCKTRRTRWELLASHMLVLSLGGRADLLLSEEALDKVHRSIFRVL